MSNRDPWEDENSEDQGEYDRERYETLQNLEDWLEGPVELLGLSWLVLLIIELIWGLNPLGETVVYAIWGVFVIDFVVRFIIAPQKLSFLRRNWLTVISLALPAFRVLAIFRGLRLLRLVRGLRGLRLVRLVGSINRGMHVLRAYLGRRKFGYMLALTLLIVLAGSAGMYAFEGEPVVENGFDHFGDALWWTAMILTTLGSEYWPQTAEGRTLGFLLALYAFSVFGYVTATLATYFIGREVTSSESDLAAIESIKELTKKIDALQTEIQELKGNSSTNSI